MEIKENCKRLFDEQKRIDSEARETIIAFLKTLPERRMSIINNPAYALVDGCDSWFEDTIYGVALQGNTLYFSMDTDISEELEDITSWDCNHMVDEQAEYVQVNWLSVLESISNIVEANKK